jgi:general secretion pathway protein G
MQHQRQKLSFAAMSRLPSAPISQRRAERGFTLLELMVVVGILGLLAALVVPNIIGQKGKADKNLAVQTIKQTETILDMYRLDVGSYPSSEDGLQALIDKPADAQNWAGPYVKGKKLPQDPWNKPLVYRFPSTRADHDYDLCSNGPNGATGSDTQICND